MPIPFDRDLRYATLYADIAELPTGSIRLVVLLPGLLQDNVCCTLVHGSIGSEYEALSYSWGFDGGPSIYDVANGLHCTGLQTTLGQVPSHSSPRTDHRPSLEAARTIEVNGHQIPVMPNLADALKNIRLEHKARVLWIDYLCINQHDVNDKNLQVGRMGEIYSGARQVIVWLGPEDADTQSALGELQRLAVNMHIDQIYPGMTAGEITKAVQPVIDLIGRPWFCRMWVIQEVILAKVAIVQIGQQLLSWDVFVEAREAHQKHLSCCAFILADSNFCSDGRKLSMINQAIPDPTEAKSSTLYQALAQFSCRTASDPRDKIFSLLSIIDGDPSDKRHLTSIRPDYKLSIRQVYQKATLEHFRSKSNINVLAVSGNFLTDQNFPSWMADFKYEHKEAELLCFRWNASPNLAPNVKHCFGDNLRSTGIPVDEISQVGEHKLRYQANKFSAESIQLCHEAMKEWEDMKSNPRYRTTQYSRPDKTTEAREEAFLQTLWLGNNDLERRRFHPRDTAEHVKWRKWLDFAVRGDFRRSLHETERVRQRQALMLSTKQAFFVTKGGYFGMAYPTAKAGDTVCILPGANVPFILRMLDEKCETCRQDCFSLVGFAYVHGIMDGEIVRLHRRHGLSSTAFCLK